MDVFFAMMSLLKQIIPIIGTAQAQLTYSVRRQGFWNQLLPKLRDRFAHLVGLIMRRVVCDASVAFRASFV